MPTGSWEPQVTALCYRTDCQKWSGGAYTSNIVISRTASKVTSRKSKTHAAVGDSGKIMFNYLWWTSISDCGSSLYAELEIMADQTCIKSGVIDYKTVRDYPVGVQFYVKDRMNYSAAVESVKQVPQCG